MAIKTSIQGRPQITGIEISGWFAEAIERRRIPNADQCRKLAGQINRYAGIKTAVRDDTPSLLIQASQEAKALSATLRFLQSRVGADTIPEVSDLQLSVATFLADFPVGAVGRHPALWSKLYLRFLPIITETLEAATDPPNARGWEPRGYDWPTSATSPALVVLARCLTHVFDQDIQPATLARFIIREKEAKRRLGMRNRSEVSPDPT